jgi:hypothetical protein
MAIVDGCQYGVAGIGGRPKQCKDPIAREGLVKAADRESNERLPLCQPHIDQLRARKIGTVYREVNGVATPVKITWQERG